MNCPNCDHVLHLNGTTKTGNLRYHCCACGWTATKPYCTVPKLIAANKWAGIVKDRIARLRSYNKIIIDPRCTYTAEEFRLYSYKVDQLNKDNHDNHSIDAIEYALAPIIKNKSVNGRPKAAP